MFYVRLSGHDVVNFNVKVICIFDELILKYKACVEVCGFRQVEVNTARS